MKTKKRSLPVSFIFYFLILLHVLLVGILFLLKDRLPLQIPLFYGKPSGINQLAQREFILLLPGGSAVLVFLNFTIYNQIKDPFLQKILLGTAIAVSVLSLITTIKISLLVGFFGL